MIKLKIDIKKVPQKEVQYFLLCTNDVKYFLDLQGGSVNHFFTKGTRYLLFSHQGGPVYHHFSKGVRNIILCCKETKFLLFFPKGAQYIFILSSFSLRRPSISCFYPRGSSISSFFQGGRVYHPFLQGDQVPPLYPRTSSKPCFFSKEVKLLLFLIQEGAL